MTIQISVFLHPRFSLDSPLWLLFCSPKKSGIQKLVWFLLSSCQFLPVTRRDQSLEVSITKASPFLFFKFHFMDGLKPQNQAQFLGVFSRHFVIFTWRRLGVAMFLFWIWLLFTASFYFWQDSIAKGRYTIFIRDPQTGNFSLARSNWASFSCIWLGQGGAGSPWSKNVPQCLSALQSLPIPGFYR